MRAKQLGNGDAGRMDLVVGPATGRAGRHSTGAGQRARGAMSRGDMARRLRDNGLALVMFACFAVSLLGQSIAGARVYNNDQAEHGEAPVSYAGYLRSGAFVEATFENWESEFLQMAAYVFLTAFLIQKGSAESKKPPEEELEGVAAPPSGGGFKAQVGTDVPAPARRGGLVTKVYENSLELALLGLFLLSFLLHAAGGAREYSAELVAHGGQAVSMLHFMGTSRFWFESLQNWQSEFLAVFTLVVLSIWLRQRGSPESKRVEDPHAKTGAQ